jgi:DNA-binding transcriptional ArsR family regulator
MLLDERAKKLIGVFDKSKLVILKAIYTCEKDICGCELVEQLNMPKNLISYHVKGLIGAGLVEFERCGKNKKIKIRDLYKVKEILKVCELI